LQALQDALRSFAEYRNALFRRKRTIEGLGGSTIVCSPNEKKEMHLGDRLVAAVRRDRALGGADSDANYVNAVILELADIRAEGADLNEAIFEWLGDEPDLLADHQDRESEWESEGPPIDDTER
jgi:hypothetical protein